MTARQPAAARSLLKFCAPGKHALENLRHGVLFCQHYARFNDPFEFWATVQTGIPDQMAEPERFAAAVRAWGFPEVSAALEYDPRQYFEEVQNYEPPFEMMFDGVRLACFGSEQDNLLMWSHYADGLRGFCIVFDEDAVVKAEPEAYAMDVLYLDQPPVVDRFVYAVAWDQQEYHLMAAEEAGSRIRSGEKDEEMWTGPYQEAADEAVAQMKLIWQQVFGTKPVEWKYERERRLLLQTDDETQTPVLRPYPRHAVREIVVGERMEPEYLAQLRSVVAEHYPHAPVRVARRAETAFTLLIE